MMSEILKSYTNEGKDHNLIFFITEVRIKMSGNPKANMASASQILDKVEDKSRGMGIILCLIDKKTYLRENLIALPIEYI